jgi:hypothetical protein
MDFQCCGGWLFSIQQQIVPFGQNAGAIGASPVFVVLDKLDFAQRRQCIF